MVLAAVASAVALLVVIVLVTPCEVEVSAVKAADDPSVRVQTRVRWLGFRLPWPDRRAARPPTKSPKKAGGRQSSIRWSTVKAVITSPGVVRRVVQLVEEEIRLIRPRRFHLRARLGFDDPSDTGMFLGWTYALGGLRDSLAASIRIEPDFTGEVAEGELRARWSRSLGAFIWPVVKFGMSPVVWRGLRAGWRSQRRP